MTTRLTIIIVFIALTLAYVGYEAYKLDNKLEAYRKEQSVEAIKNLPDISLKYFSDESKLFNLKQSADEGNYLFIHFWATWCGPCETEFPDLVSLTELIKSKKNVKFLFIAVNDEVKKVKKFLEKFKDQSNFVVLVDNDFIHQKYFNTFKLPETLVFGSNSALLKKFVGPQQWTQAHIVNFFNQL